MEMRNQVFIIHKIRTKHCNSKMFWNSTGRRIWRFQKYWPTTNIPILF